MTTDAGEAPPARLDTRAAAALLALLSLAAFSSALGFGFAPIDDADYVTGNPWVQHGFSRSQLWWALSRAQFANWHPLTWLSHTLDWSLFGASASGHHLTSLLLHAVNTVLLFLFFLRTTARLWPALLTAALFGVHPLRVESVVWISERKDVLSGLCFFLLLLAYAAYARRPTARGYALVFLLHAAGLSAKPMLVTTPLVLLLLDRWPLLRDGAERRRLVLEKVPLLALSAISAAITLLAQRAGGAMAATDLLPWSTRLANALASTATYLKLAVWPSHLAVHYLRDSSALSQRWPQLAGSALLLGLLLGLGLWQRQRRPQLLVGLLWLLVMLLPVLGLVPVGGQAVADRYTYLPLLGPCAALAFSLPWRTPTKLGAVATVVVLFTLSLQQTEVWRSDRALLGRALEVSPGDTVIEWGLAGLLLREGKLDEAEAAYRAILRRQPEASRPLAALGVILLRRGKPEEALPLLRHAAAIEPEVTHLAPHLAQALSLLGKEAEAIALLEPLTARNPDYPLLQRELGTALAIAGRLPEAQEHLERALALAPDDPLTELNLGVLLSQRGRVKEAKAHLQRALQLDPSLSQARRLLEEARTRLPEKL